MLQEALKGLTKLTSLAGKADAAGIPEKPNYSIEYETRASSRLFIEQIAQKKAGDGSISDSPDHLYMWHAYQFISEWFLSHDENFISKALAESVKIIWYELPVAVENWQKFTDLNVGKIPLTNSELVKALFLRSDSGSLQMPEYEKETLIAQWDEMERELHDLDFWYFLTTDAPELYPTRIDFIFNLIAGKKRDNKDDFFTFDYFVEKFQKEADRSGKQQWDDIYLKYQRIRDWYRDRELYHQIGYLVSTGYKALGEIFKVAYPDDEKLLKTRSEFRIYLEDSISDSIKMPEKDGKTLADLSYGTDDTLITRILTLYNIMVCEAVAGHVRYPFARHNAVSGGWSLEHIHAQNSEDLKKAEHWKEWIAAHKATLQAVVEAGILDEESTLRAEGLIGGFENFDRDPTRVLFAKLAGEFEAVMNSLPGASGLRKNEIRNLALLGRDMNAVLNNSTFDVKRRKIISMVGTDYVPIATERAFLKAIAGHRTDSEGNYIPGGEYECNASQIFFWGEQDRQAYLADIEEKLKKYRRQ